MALKNIPLPANVIINLYKYCLTDSRNYLGGNNKNILLLVKNGGCRFLPYDQITFLSEILVACKLCMNDIAIINLNNPDTPDFKPLATALRPEIFILSGVELSMLALPFKIPAFQVQLYENKKYLHIPPLGAIQNDANLKRKLWELLKVLFSV